ncbi:hypothetical protein [Oceanicoccus sagamiensis]|uniref:Uncharacterized protein n=1 Tax=Oceanicoccus sagamiensis TaxID=716816 RepID=A0A1X9NHI2_9GAMM|nr:hypothetical protein [Oceanicoccus sagamiensis]ARN75862.1 hypothetical protein BST96_18190 [Oceanicoccus sagamiensis]
MADDKDDTEAQEVTLEDKIEMVRRKSFTQLWVGIVFMPVLLIVFVAGLITLASAHKTTSTMTAKKPENRVELFAKKIVSVKSRAEGQYGKYLSKMDDESIFTVNKKFEILYELSMESEEQYTEFLEAYQAMVYGAASRTRGSGEWFYYYEQKINRFVNAAKGREQTMKQYFERD